MNISILGTGSFASALAQLLTDNGNKVLMWTLVEKEVLEINTKKTNKYYYDDLVFSSNVKATTNLEEIINFSDYLIIALPSKFIKDTLKKIDKLLKNTNKKINFINVSKGMDYKNLVTISEMINQNINKKNLGKVCTMTGPTFAKEIIERKITKFILASKKDTGLDTIQKLFENEYIIIERSKDIKGIELLSSIKNIVALAAGISNGLGYNENTHAIIITKGIEEMTKIAPFYDIKAETILSVAGIGDLVLTASSKTSRNYLTGFKIGSGEKIDKAIKTTKTVVEGVECAKVMYKFSKEHKIDLPITKAMYNIFYKEKNPKEELKNILK